tara:strand:- start:5882 stop:6478 length:597 start_codon:yes stop_codon:yes gene_type:complete
MKENVSNIKSITIIGLIVYIIFLQQCYNKQSTSIITETTDTTRVTVIDTLPFSDTVKHHIRVTIPEKITVYDTMFSIVRDTVDTTVYTYLQNVEDSLLEGLIETKVKGFLISNDFTYTPKFPKYIYRIDTIKTKTVVKIEERKFKIGVGAEIGGSQSAFNLSPIVALNTGNGFTYNYRYGVMDKTHNIGIIKTLKFKK